MSDENKSHVTMVTRICVVCGNEYSTNEIALDTKPRKIFHRSTCMGWGECPEHKTLLDQDNVAMVEIDVSKSVVHENSKIKKGEEYRTGRVAIVDRPSLQKIVNMDISSHRVVMIDKSQFDELFPPDVMATVPEEDLPTAKPATVPGSNAIN